MYGENLGTGTLTTYLVGIAQDIRDMRNDGHPADERMVALCKDFMEGAMVLWERVTEEHAERMCG